MTLGMPLHRDSGSWGHILLGLTLKQQLSTRLALMICLRRKLTVGKKSRVTGGGGIAMSRRFSTSTLLTRPKPFPSEARPYARRYIPRSRHLFGRVAQPDRASAFDAERCRVEHCRGRQMQKLCLARA